MYLLVSCWLLFSVDYMERQVPCWCCSLLFQIKRQVSSFWNQIGTVFFKSVIIFDKKMLCKVFTVDLVFFANLKFSRLEPQSNFFIFFRCSWRWPMASINIIFTNFSLSYSPKYAVAIMKRKIYDKNPHVARYGLIVSAFVWIMSIK